MTPQDIERYQRTKFQPAPEESPADVRIAHALEFIAARLHGIEGSLDHLGEAVHQLADRS